MFAIVNRASRTSFLVFLYGKQSAGEGLGRAKALENICFKGNVSFAPSWLILTLKTPTGSITGRVRPHNSLNEQTRNNSSRRVFRWKTNGFYSRR